MSVLLGFSESLDMLVKLGSCIGRKGPFKVVLSRNTDEQSVVNTNGDNVITLGGKGEAITVTEIYLQLSNLVLQGNCSSLIFEGIQKMNDTTFVLNWGT